jgi:hypothetical protein
VTVINKVVEKPIELSKAQAPEHKSTEVISSIEISTTMTENTKSAELEFI